MKLAIGTFQVILVIAQFGLAQQTAAQAWPARMRSPESEPSANSYTIIDATPVQEAALRTQIRLMHPEVLPLRIIFVPHWKYLDTARIFRLHVPAGCGSLMFTHLPSRTVFIDNDRYLGEEWLGHWMAHELGHLATNSAREEDAEKAAREFRRRLKDTRKQESVSAPMESLTCSCFVRCRPRGTRNYEPYVSGK